MTSGPPIGSVVWVALRGQRAGGRGRVPADPLVLPGPFDRLLVAAWPVDRAEFVHDLLAVGGPAAGHLVRANVDPPTASGPPDPAVGPGMVERELFGRQVVGVP